MRPARPMLRIPQGSIHSLILRALVAVGLATVLVRVATLGREFLIAREYGVGSDVDALVVAILVPTFLVAVLADSLNQALIPTFTRVTQSDPDAGRILLSQALVGATELLAFVSLLTALGAPLVVSAVAPGFDDETARLTVHLMRVMLPSVVLGGVASIWAAALTAGEKFLLASLAPICLPLSAAAAILLLGRGTGVSAVAVGVTVGYTLQLVPLAIALRRVGLLRRPSRPAATADLTHVVKQYLPLAAVAALNGTSLFVDQAVTSRLGDGEVSVLYYGNRLVSLVIGVISIAVGTAVLPYFSRQAAQRDWGQLARTVKLWSIGSAAGAAAVAAVLILLSGPLVALMFQRGEFTPGAAVHVTAVQRAYLLQLPFFGLTIIAARALSALRANHVILWGAALNLGLNVVLDIVLADLLGVVGIALATATVFPLSACFLLVCLRSRLRAAVRAADAAPTTSA